MGGVSTAQFPRKLAFLVTEPLGSLRYRAAYGGRGSAKSWQFARALLILGTNKALRILCTREFQSSIRDSVHKLLSDQIRLLGLGDFYDVQRDGIFGLNGTEFIFKGLRHDPNGIASTEGIDICWVEEASAVSDASWEILIPTIRKAGSEIWLSFNPGEPTDPTWQRFVVDPPPRSMIVKVGYRDNPWLPDVLKEEADTLKRRDPEAYAHVWGGEPWRRSDLQVFTNYEIAEVIPQPHWQGPYFGADWGFSNDPTVLVKLYVADSRLYFAAESGGVQLLAEDMVRAFDKIPGSRDYRIRADSSRPETIAEMKRRGFKILPASKGEGSVKDGIEYIRGQFDTIVVDPSCTGVIEELRMYRYKADPKTGDPLPILVDAWNHRIDAARYALEPLIKKAQPQLVWYPGMETTDGRKPD